MLEYNIYIFRSGTGTNTTKFLHMTTNTEQKTQVHTKGTHISTSFTRSPENGKMTIIIEFKQLGFMNSTNTQLTLDSRNKRRTLEKSTSKSFNGLFWKDEISIAVTKECAWIECLYSFLLEITSFRCQWHREDGEYRRIPYQHLVETWQDE